MSNKWPEVPLGEILTERKEIPDAGALASGEIPIVSKIAFKDGKIQLRADGETKTGMILARQGDLLVSGINAAKGAIAVYNGGTPVAATIHYGAYTPNKKRVDVNYLWWLLRSRAFKELLEKYVPGGIKTELKAKRLLPIPVPLPSLSEQSAIACYIETIHKKMEELAFQTNSLANETGKLFEKCFEKVCLDYPVNGTLGDVLVSKPRNGWSAQCDNAENGTPVLTLRAVTGFKYTSSAYKRTSLPVIPNAHYWLRENDLLITRSNTAELVGHAAIYNGTPSPCIYPDLIMRLDLNVATADTRFVWYWLQSPIARQFITSKAKGTSPTMKKISQEIVMRVPFPSGILLAEQRDIVRRLDILWEKHERLVTNKDVISKQLELLFPSIVKNIFTGEVQ
jgi:type I restriction enzyme S subunit